MKKQKSRIFYPVNGYEILASPADLEYYLINGSEYAYLKSEIKNNAVVRLFARPVEKLAFIPTIGEPVILTNGNGLWIPVATGKVGGPYSLYPWAKHYRGDVKHFYSNFDSFLGVDLNCGPELYVNTVIAILENSLFSDDVSELSEAELQKIRAYLELALSEKPWHHTAKLLKSTLQENSRGEMNSLLHADRISWLIPKGDIERIIDEYEQGIEYTPHVALLHFVMASAFRQVENNIEQYVEYLDKTLDTNPNFSRALFDKALIFCNNKDEESEMEYYHRAAEADTDYPEPWYNMAITYRDREDFKNMIECYMNVLSRDPFHVTTLENLCIFGYHTENIDALNEYLPRMLAANPYREQSYQTALKICEDLELQTTGELVRDALLINDKYFFPSTTIKIPDPQPV